VGGQPYMASEGVRLRAKQTENWGQQGQKGRFPSRTSVGNLSAVQLTWS
jgi:hypothetical protein